MSKLQHSLDSILKCSVAQRRTYRACFYILLMAVTLIGSTVFRTKKSLYVHIPEDEEVSMNQIVPSQVSESCYYLDNY